MGLQKSNHTIATLKLNDKFAEKDIDKANMLNDYFCSQAVVNNNNNHYRNKHSHATSDLTQLQYLNKMSEMS